MIDVTNITTKSLDGSGIFDCFMAAAKLHLQQEYDNSRIRGPEYSQVYTSLLQNAISQSIQYESSVVQNELARKQIELAEQQRLKAIQDVKVSEEQVKQLVKQTELICEQIITAGKQNEKITKEIELLEQKRLTEKAQTDGTNINETSILGRQTSLYKAQADGYYRDALQKAVNKLIDTWQVRRTTDNGTTANAENKLQDTVIGTSLCTLLANLGVNELSLEIGEAKAKINALEAAVLIANEGGNIQEIAAATQAVLAAREALAQLEAQVST